MKSRTSQNLDFYRKKLIDKNQLPDKLKSFVSDIIASKFTSNINIFVLKDESDKFLIVVDLLINLPSRGTVGDIDIRKKERVIIKVNNELFPYKAPTVIPNRIDFPTDKLPHINHWPGIGNYIPSLCLHRGNIDEWFIENSTYSFISRIRSWYKDAAAGTLLPEYDEFEATRISDPTFRVSFDYENIVEYIKLNNPQRKHDGEFAYFIGKLLSNRIVIENKLFKRNEHATFLKTFTELSSNDLYTYGIIVWPDLDRSVDTYLVGNQAEKLRRFYMEKTNVDLFKKIELASAQAIDKIEKQKINMPIILAIPRPRKLIEYNTNMELLLCFADMQRKKITKFGVHSRIFSTDLARKLSGIKKYEEGQSTIIAGCGALGSKIAVSLVSNGFKQITFVDNDILSEHNLVRHALTHREIVKYKAEELCNLAQNTNRDSDAEFTFSNKSIIELYLRQDKIVDTRSILLDFTTSNVVLNFLTNKVSQIQQSVIRGELAHEGKLGILQVEGSDRDVKIDELRVSIYDSAVELDCISDWLQMTMKDISYKPEFEEITIGLSCNTHTMVMADEVINYHASLMVSQIKKILMSDKWKSKYIISLWDANNTSNNKVYLKEASCFEVHTDGEWSIKISQNFLQDIKQEMEKSKGLECGGAILGFRDDYNKIIYVTRTILDRNAEATKQSLVIGSNTHSKEISDVIDRTGGLISYRGDWHSHPGGILNLSKTDENQIKKLHVQLPEEPVLLSLIVNEKGIATFISNE